MMFTLQNLAYRHPNTDVLFAQLNLTVNPQDKIALIGNNGSGKSTLLKIIAGQLQPSDGQLQIAAEPYYIPQIFGQFNDLTIAQALRIETKIAALGEILSGQVTEQNYAALDDDWTIEERAQEALAHWQLCGLDLARRLGTLSGGQKTKVLLSGLSLHQPQFILLDEPSNHLDLQARQLLYDFVRTTSSTLLIVSHDRKLLNLLDTVCELKSNQISVYGGNYDFYSAQKKRATDALSHDIHSKEKSLRQAREKQRETMERQQKSDVRGKKKQEKSGVARIMLNTLRNNAENSTSKIKSVHAEKIDGISGELRQLRNEASALEQMKLDFDYSSLRKGKILFAAEKANYNYDDHRLWQNDLDFELASGERIAIKGSNGSGKTTLIKLILGRICPEAGRIQTGYRHAVYIDQDYAAIDNSLTVYEQAERFNVSGLGQHEIRMRLNRFLFGPADWDKPCPALSGGERMRLTLCGLTIDKRLPDLMILDEPTNNLDIQNIEILTAAVGHYRGTLVVVSHDTVFLQQIGLSRELDLDLISGSKKSP